jgi:hypothetical protein
MAKNPPWLRALRASLSSFSHAIRRYTSMGPLTQRAKLRNWGFLLLLVLVLVLVLENSDRNQTN